MYNETLKTAKQAMAAYKIEIYNQNILLTETINKMYRFKALINDSFNSEYFAVDLLDTQKSNYETEQEKETLYELVKRIEKELEANKNLVANFKVNIKYGDDVIQVKINHDINDN